MAKKRVAKKEVSDRVRVVDMGEEQAPSPWGESLVRFFDENDVGMDAVWQGRELDDFDYYYFMSSYEVCSLLPGLAEATASFKAGKTGGLLQFLHSGEGLASFAHLYGGSGSFRYALPNEGDLS
jgi:hypothetical protein